MRQTFGGIHNPLRFPATCIPTAHAISSRRECSALGPRDASVPTNALPIWVLKKPAGSKSSMPYAVDRLARPFIGILRCRGHASSPLLSAFEHIARVLTFFYLLLHSGVVGKVRHRNHDAVWQRCDAVSDACPRQNKAACPSFAAMTCVGASG